MHTCTACGFLSMLQKINPEKSTLICPECGFEDAVFFKPLFVITGGAGCGKSTVAQGLKGRLPCIVFEPDYFLRARDTFETWDVYWSYIILFCRTLTQNGSPVIVPGWVNPSMCEASPHIDYFSSVHYLILSCDKETQEGRLRGRSQKFRQEPPTNESIANALKGTRTLKEEASQRENATIIDTSDLVLNEVLVRAESWITSRL